LLPLVVADQQHPFFLLIPYNVLVLLFIDFALLLFQATNNGGKRRGRYLFAHLLSTEVKRTIKELTYDTYTQHSDIIQLK